MADKIPMTDVESKSLSAIGYDAKKKILSVRFRSGAIYHHGSFDENHHTDLLESASLGAHYNAHIKGKHPGAKMTGSCPNCGARHGWLGESCSDCGTAAYAQEPEKAK